MVVEGGLAAEHTVAYFASDPLLIPLLRCPVDHLLMFQQVTLNVEHLVASGWILSCAVSFMLAFQAGLVKYV